MADYEPLQLKVGLDTKVTAQDAKQLANSIQKAFDGIDPTKLDSRTQTFMKNMQAARVGVEKLADEMQRFANTKIPTEEYKWLTKELEKAQDAVTKLQEKQDALSNRKAALIAARDNSAANIKAAQEEVRRITEEQRKPMASPQLAVELQKAQDKVTELNQSYKDAVKGLESMDAQWTKINADIDQAKLKANTYKDDMEYMREQGTAFTMGKDTPEYEAMQQKLNQQYNAGVILMERYSEAQDKVAANEDKLAQKEAERADKAMQKSQQELEARTEQQVAAAAAREQERASYVAKQHAESMELLHRATSRTMSVLSGMGRAIRTIVNPLRLFSRHSREAGRHQLNLRRTMKKSINILLRYTLGIRSLYMLFRKLRGYVKEAFKVMAQEIPEVNKQISDILTSFKQFKASTGTLLQPLLQAFGPAIDTIIQKLVDLMNTLAKLFAQLTGQNYIYKATVDYYDYAKAVDEANGSLASFDKLNTISQQKNSMGLTKDTVHYAKEYFKAINLADNKLVKTLTNLWSSLKKNLKKVKSLILTIGDDIKQVFGGELGESIFTHVQNTLQNIFDIIGNISENFENAWNTDNIGVDILTDIAGIFESIWGFLDKITAATAEWALNVDLVPALSGIRDVLDEIGGEKGLVANILDIVGTLYTDYLLDIASWTVEKGLPAVLTIVKDVLKEINTALIWVKAKLRWLMDNVISPIAGTIGTAVTDFLDKVHTTIEEKISPALSDLRKFFDEKLSPALKKVFKWLTPKLQLAIFIVGKLLELLIETIGNAVAAVVANIELGWNTISDFVSNVKGAFSGIIEFFEGTFRGDLDKAWDGIKTVFVNAINGIITLVEGFLNGIINGINVVGGLVGIKIPEVHFGRLGEEETKMPTAEELEAVKKSLQAMENPVADAMLQLLEELKTYDKEALAGSGVTHNGSGRTFEKNAFSTAEEFYKESYNMVIEELNSQNEDNPWWMKLPKKLAQGAVLPPNKPFLAIVGDQKNGTNVEAPLATIEQAVANVLSSIILKAEFDVSGDPKGLFKVIRKEAKVYYNQTGNNAYAVN